MKKHFLTITILGLLLCFCVGCASKKQAEGTEHDTYYVPIVMYHRVYTENNGEYCITPQELECDLQYLAENDYTAVTISELIEFKNGNFTMPQNPIVLTFDDGHYNNYTHALPLLKKYSQKATFFIIGEFSERFSKRDTKYSKTSYLGFSEIAEMASTGLCDIQNHTYDMHDWTRGRFGVKQKDGESFASYKTALSNDVLKTQQLLKENVGVTPLALAYPFGAYSSVSKEILQELGFCALLTCNAGINKISRTEKDDMLNLKRINRPHDVENLDAVFAQYNSTKCLVKSVQKTNK